MSSLAERLRLAELSGAAIAIDPADFPADEAAVVAVQNEVFRLAARHAGGWKAGPPPEGMADTGCAPLASEWTRISPATVRAPGQPLLVESEFVLRFGFPVLPESAPHTPLSISAYIDALAPGIELVWRRVTNPGGPETALLYQADANGHAGMVLGEWRENWRELDLANLKVTQYRNGKVHAEGSSAKTMGGNPLAVAAALANREARLGRALPAGVWVTTGSCTGALEIQPGDTIRSEYPDLGVVQVTIAG
ncbi:MAG: hypothetical protein KDC18_10195 [Alphaproteobacteria bacterium]|nr:hypothetical protein [Alphaproteobacteria bacterium]MCB9927885.1 hypothetical protein [Alphaproteobacteria bacterium]